MFLLSLLAVWALFDPVAGSPAVRQVYRDIADMGSPRGEPLLIRHLFNTLERRVQCYGKVSCERCDLTDGVLQLITQPRSTHGNTENARISVSSFTHLAAGCLLYLVSPGLVCTAIRQGSWGEQAGQFQREITRGQHVEVHTLEALLQGLQHHYKPLHRENCVTADDIMTEINASFPDQGQEVGAVLGHVLYHTLQGHCLTAPSLPRERYFLDYIMDRLGSENFTVADLAALMKSLERNFHLESRYSPYHQGCGDADQSTHHPGDDHTNQSPHRLRDDHTDHFFHRLRDDRTDHSTHRLRDDRTDHSTHRLRDDRTDHSTHRLRDDRTDHSTHRLRDDRTDHTTHHPGDDHTDHSTHRLRDDRTDHNTHHPGDDHTDHSTHRLRDDRTDHNTHHPGDDRTDHSTHRLRDDRTDHTTHHHRDDRTDHTTHHLGDDRTNHSIQHLGYDCMDHSTQHLGYDRTDNSTQHLGDNRTDHSAHSLRDDRTDHTTHHPGDDRTDHSTHHLGYDRTYHSNHRLRDDRTDHTTHHLGYDRTDHSTHHPGDDRTEHSTHRLRDDRTDHTTHHPGDDHTDHSTHHPGDDHTDHSTHHPGDDHTDHSTHHPGDDRTDHSTHHPGDDRTDHSTHHPGDDHNDHSTHRLRDDHTDHSDPHLEVHYFDYGTHYRGDGPPNPYPPPRRNYRAAHGAGRRRKRSSRELLGRLKGQRIWDQTCFSAEELLKIFGLPTSGLSRSDMAWLSPALLQQILSGACTKTKEDLKSEGLDQRQRYLYATVSNVVIMLASMLGIVLLLCGACTSVFELFMHFCTSLAVGSLTGDALLHLIPMFLGLPAQAEDARTQQQEAGAHGRLLGETPDYIYKMLGVFVGIYCFYLMETISWRSCKARGTNHLLPPVQEEADPHHCEEEDNEKDAPPSSLAHLEAYMGAKLPTVPKHRTGERPLLPYTMSFSEGIRNFADGLAVGAAFSVSWKAGLATSVAVLCHELARELGDFIILLRSGVSAHRALLLSVGSALTSFVGLYIALHFATGSVTQQWIGAITAGRFLYLALAELLPTMIHLSHERPWLIISLHSVGLLAGWGAMLSLTLWERIGF